MAAKLLREIRPQKGPQEKFLSSPADIVVYGGGAGGGKTWGEIVEPIRHIENPNFGAVIFRRTSPQIFNEGGLWDEASRIYPHLGARPRGNDWIFPSGMTVSMSHLIHETTKFNWQGSQIPLIEFDELTHFSESQFWYMLSRNRSMCGVRPYVRATCNPDVDSWVAKFIAWWIDPETGYAIPERSGVLRWFVRVNNELFWADTPQELAKYRDGNGRPIPPKSVTFIAASIYDNPALMKADPGYLANLMALPIVEQERLLGCNWKVRKIAGEIFQLAHFERKLKVLPSGYKWVRYWDLAGSDKKKADFTVGVLMGIGISNGEKRVCVADVVRGQWREYERNKQITRALEKDRQLLGQIKTYIEDLPGVAKAAVDAIIDENAGYSVEADRPQGDKVSRADPYSTYCQAGKTDLMDAPWNEAYVDEFIAFPHPKIHDDQVDASSGAFKKLTEKEEDPVEYDVEWVTL